MIPLANFSGTLFCICPSDAGHRIIIVHSSFLLAGPSTMLHSISEPCINSAELYFCPNVTQNDASAYDLMIKNYWGHFLSKYLKLFLILNENLDSI